MASSTMRMFGAHVFDVPPDGKLVRAAREMMVRWLKGSSVLLPIPITPSESDQNFHKRHFHLCCLRAPVLHTVIQLGPQINTESAQHVFLTSLSLTL